MKNIKNIKNIFLAGLALMSLTTVSCVESIETPVVPPEMNFQTEGKLYMSDKEVKEVSFTATSIWDLTSNAGWCKFLDGEDEVSSLSGEAGEQTVKIIVHGDGLKQGDASQLALLELQEETGMRVISQVVISSPEYQIFLMDKTGDYLLDKAGEKIDIRDTVFTLPLTGYTPELYLKANFDNFFFVNIPDYINVNRLYDYKEYKDENGQKLPVKQSGLKKTKLGIKKYKMNVVRPMEGELIITDAEGKAIIPVKWKFDAYDTKVDIDGPSRTTSWDVDLSGKIFTQAASSDMMGGGSDLIMNDYLSYGYDGDASQLEVFFMTEKDGKFACSLVDQSINWMHFDTENLILTVDAAETPRVGYVYLIQKEMSDYVTAENWEEVLLVKAEDGTISLSNDMFNKNCIAKICQHEPVIADDSKFFVVKTNEGEELEVVPETNQAVLDAWAQMGVPAAYIFKTTQESAQLTVSIIKGSATPNGGFTALNPEEKCPFVKTNRGMGMDVNVTFEEPKTDPADPNKQVMVPWWIPEGNAIALMFVDSSSNEFKILVVYPKK